MPDPLDRLQSFLVELKRRKVYRVAVTYVIVAFAGLEAVDLLIPSTTLPAWAGSFLLAIAIMGFPVAVVVAWAFELTPEGVRRTPSAQQDVAPGTALERRNRLTPIAVVALGLLATAVAAGWYVVGGGGGNSDVMDRSIAVLPFETLGSQETTPFTDGVHGDLLTRLSHISGLRVTSRTSVMRYRTPDKPLPAIAAELGVAWVLHGEVQETGDRVKVNARLSDAAADRQVWAESYEEQLTAANLFEIQAEIARQIAHALETRLSPREERQVERAPTENLDAYRLYSQGRELLDRRTEDGMHRALDYFQRAIAEDSSYALAWVGLADGLALLKSYRYADSAGLLSRAEDAALRALELSPESAQAHASLGLLRSVRQDGPAAVRELRRAIELRPSYADAHNWLSWVQQLLGHREEALESARRAVELDPLSPEAVSNLSLAYLATGDHEAALAEARHVDEIQTSWGTARFYEGLALYHLGRYAEASSALETLTVPWAGAGPLATLALSQAADGDTAAARDLLAQIDGARYPFAVGLVHFALGEREDAFDAFQGASVWAEWPTLAVRDLYSEVLDPLRDDPRYGALLSDVDGAWGMADPASAAAIVEIIAKDYAFQAPPEVPSGWVTFSLKNEGREHHFVFLSRLPDGKTVEDYREEVAKPFDAVWDELEAGADRAEAGAMLGRLLPDWYGSVRPMGANGLLAPGETARTTVKLDPGRYVMECYVKTADGTFHTSLGMMRGLTVTDSPSGGSPPEADIEITLTNFEISVAGDVTAGAHTVAVHFEEHPEFGLGNDVHLVRLDDGMTVDDIVPWMDWMNLEGLRSPAPASFLGGTEEMPVGYTAYFTVELQPGRYAWIAESAAALGMVEEFTVD